MRLRLIEDWHQAWRWSSVRFLAIGGVVQAALLTFPAMLLQFIPQWILQTLAVLSLICVILAGVGRITLVEKPHDPSPAP